MVQALINNMNIENSDKFSVTDNRVSTDTQKDFSGILKAKTTKTDDTQAKSDFCTDTDSCTVMTLGMMKNTVSETTESISSIIYNIIEEDSAETALNLTIVKDEDLINESCLPVDTTTEELNVNTDVIDEDNTTTETITKDEETPTMNETLLTQPPENPILSLVWHTQVHSSKQTDETPNIEAEENSKPVISIKIDNTKSESEFKNLMPKENLSENVALEETAEDDEVITKNEGIKLNDIITEEMAEDLHIETVQAETGAKKEGSSEFMFYQPPQEQSIKGMLFGSIKYEPIQTMSEPQNAAMGSKILEQITKQMEAMHNTSKVEMVLNPESLGRVALHIMNTKDGLMAQFTVTNQDIRNMLMKGLGSLKDNLLAHGVNVDNVSVKLSEATESEYKFDWTEGENSGNGYKHQNPQKQKQDEKQFEQMMFEIENNDNV